MFWEERGEEKRSIPAVPGLSRQRGCCVCGGRGEAHSFFASDLENGLKKLKKERTS